MLGLPSPSGEQWWSQQSRINTLTLSQATTTVLTFSEPATLECVAGTVTFTMHGADLACRWTSNVEQNTAILHKTRGDVLTGAGR